MKGTLAILFVLLIATATANQPLKFQFGSSLARLIRGEGVVNIVCYGGVAPYIFNFSNLPLGWTQQGNNLVIPGLAGLRGNYAVRANVRDSAGNTLTGNINLNINGLAITIESGPNFTDNTITYNIGGQPQGGAGGSPSGGSPAGGSPNGGSPNGGSPNGGSPNGGSPSGGLPGASDLYDSYPGLPAGTNVFPPIENLPRFPSPTGPPSTPNIVPTVIRTIQAPYVPTRDSNPTTVDDIKRTAIFNRQLNANKGIANLVTIIRQLTANVNAAQNDIKVLQQALNQAQNQYNSCNQIVFNLADTRAKIENAIADRQGRLNTVNGQINKLLPEIDQLKKTLDSFIIKRTQAQTAESPNAAKLSDLERELANCQTELNGLISQLDSTRNDISDLQRQIQEIREDVAAAPFEIQRIDLQIPIIDRKIQDLRAQLNDAITQKQNLLNEQQGYRTLISSSNAKIATLQSRISSLNSRIPSLQTRISSTRTKCSAIQQQLNAFRAKLAENQQSFQILLEQIKAQEALINSKQSQIDSLRESIKDLPNQLAILRSELARSEASIRRQYYICNAAADEVRKAKQNLDAMNQRAQTDTQFLAQANNNLERARAEKELADIAVQQLISSSTEALPFSIVPNGNGQTPAGTPAGNNPSGSPLGPVPVRNEVQGENRVVVGDLSTYLSRAYQAGVDPARPETVSSVYPLSVVTLEALINRNPQGVINPNPQYQPPANAILNFQCSPTAQNMVYGQGSVYSLQPGRIQLKDQNGEIVTLQIGGCTNLEATQDKYVLAFNDQVYYKGIPNGSNIWTYSITCVA